MTGDFGDPYYFPLRQVKWFTEPSNFAALVENSNETDFSTPLFHFGNSERNFSASFMALKNGSYILTIECGDQKRSSEIIISELNTKAELKIDPKKECRIKVSPKP